MCAWGLIDRCSFAEVAEALAYLEGARAMMPTAANLVQLESDCAAVVHELSDKGNRKSEISCIISEVKHLLSEMPGYRVRKINSTANLAAYSLASFCHRVGSGGMLQELVRPCVEK